MILLSQLSCNYPLLFEIQLQLSVAYIKGEWFVDRIKTHRVGRSGAKNKQKKEKKRHWFFDNTLVISVMGKWFK